MIPDQPPPLDLGPILERAAKLAEARAKATAVPDPIRNQGYLHPASRALLNASLDDDLCPDVRALAAEVERLRKRLESLGLNPFIVPQAEVTQEGDEVTT